MRAGDVESECARLSALNDCEVLDTPAEPQFDELAELASRLVEMPFAGISIVDERRLWFKSTIGLDFCGAGQGDEIVREGSFCDYVLKQSHEVMMVADAHADPRFTSHPLVTDEPRLRFYAGAPVALPDGHKVGVLWVADRQSRNLDTSQTRTLVSLARQIGTQLALRRSNSLLSQRETELRLIFETNGEAILRLDAKGRCTLVNPACVRILGYPDSAALLGKNMHSLIHYRRADGRHYPEEECAFAQALREGRELRVEDEVIWRADGTPIWVILTLSPIRHGGRVVGGVVNLVDMTEQRRAREELAAVARVRERFTGVLGHDLRNPLSTVLMGAKLIADRQDTTTTSRATATRVVHAAERMRRLIGDLLDFVRIGQGHGFPLSLRQTDLAETARQIVAEFELAQPERRVELEASGEVIGMWDPDRLAQVCSNLVANAVQHGTADQPVGVRVRQEKEHAVLTVENGGPAIPTHLLPHIFDPFRRGAPLADPRPAQRGLGLGLFIVRQTALAHGGDVSIVSDAGHTVFTVRLPIQSGINAARVH